MLVALCMMLVIRLYVVRCSSYVVDLCLLVAVVLFVGWWLVAVVRGLLSVV